MWFNVLSVIDSISVKDRISFPTLLLFANFVVCLFYLFVWGFFGFFFSMILGLQTRNEVKL